MLNNSLVLMGFATEQAIFQEFYHDVRELYQGLKSQTIAPSHQQQAALAGLGVAREARENSSGHVAEHRGFDSLQPRPRCRTADRPDS